MANVCVKCGTSNRDGAGFCGGCGAPLRGQPSPPPAAPPAYQPPPQRAASPAPQPPPAAAAALQPQAPAAVAAVGQAAKTAAKTAAQKSWEASKQGMGFLSRLLTGGGRAAYTELFHPIAVIRGYVIAQPVVAPVPTPLELGAFLFAAAMILGWLVLLLKDQGIALPLVLLLAWILLLALSRWGVRQPYFSRLTLDRLLSLLGNKTKGQVQRLRCTVNNNDTGQPVDVVVIGARPGPMPTYGQWVEVWGIPETGRNEVRAWRVEVKDQTGYSHGFLVAARLIPLTVALFLPLMLITVVGLVIMLTTGGTP